MVQRLSERGARDEYLLLRSRKHAAGLPWPQTLRERLSGERDVEFNVAASEAAQRADSVRRRQGRGRKDLKLTTSCSNSGPCRSGS